MTLYTASRRIYVAAESSYSQSPRPTDASYMAVPVTEVDARDRRTLLQTNRLTGNAGPTPHIPGGGQGEVPINSQFFGLSAQSLSSSPPAADWLDLLMSSWGLQSSRDGGPVSSAGASQLTPPAGYVEGDLLPLVSATGQLQWVYARSTSSGDLVSKYAYGLTPASLLASRQTYDANFTDVPSLAAAFQRLAGGSAEEEVALPGMRMTAWSGTIPAREPLPSWSSTWQSDDFDDSDSFTFTEATNGTHAVTATEALQVSQVFVDGVEVPCSTVSIAATIVAPTVGTTARSSGRQDHLLADLQLTVTLQPRYETAWQDLKQSGDLREIVVQLQGADPGSGPAERRSFVICLPNAQLEGADPVDAGGVLEQGLPFAARQVGTERRWIMARS